MGPTMKLQTYLTSKKESPNAFAGRIGVPPHTVYRYLAGRVPRPDIMAAVYKASSGKVEPNDFYELPSLRSKKKAKVKA
jgi:predicted transcriptional regulator